MLLTSGMDQYLRDCLGFGGRYDLSIQLGYRLERTHTLTFPIPICLAYGTCTHGT